MARLYWYDSCRHCEQGRLFLFLDQTNKKIYLHCEECEWGWHDPENININAGFLTLNEEFDAIPATISDIISYGWGEYAKKTYENS